jgi:ddrB-like ParB superfamily domain
MPDISVPAPPPGFELETAAPPPPPGFELETAAPAAAAPAPDPNAVPDAFRRARDDDRALVPAELQGKAAPPLGYLGMPYNPKDTLDPIAVVQQGIKNARQLVRAFAPVMQDDGTLAANTLQGRPNPLPDSGQLADIGNAQDTSLLPLSAGTQPGSLVNGAAKAAEGFFTPQSLEIIAVAGPLNSAANAARVGYSAAALRAINMALHGYFTVQMAKGAGENIGQAVADWQNGDMDALADHLGAATVDTILAAAGIAHGYTQLKDIGKVRIPNSPEPPEQQQGGFTGPYNREQKLLNAPQKLLTAPEPPPGFEPEPPAAAAPPAPPEGFEPEQSPQQSAPATETAPSSNPAPSDPTGQDPAALRARLGELNDQIIKRGGNVPKEVVAERTAIKSQLDALGEPTWKEGEEQAPPAAAPAPPSGFEPEETVARVGDLQHFDISSVAYHLGLSADDIKDMPLSEALDRLRKVAPAVADMIASREIKPEETPAAAAPKDVNFPIALDWVRRNYPDLPTDVTIKLVDHLGKVSGLLHQGSGEIEIQHRGTQNNLHRVENAARKMHYAEAIVHELTHAQQAREGRLPETNRVGGSDYLDRPHEKEAFAAGGAARERYARELYSKQPSAATPKSGAQQQADPGQPEEDPAAERTDYEKRSALGAWALTPEEFLRSDMRGIRRANDLADVERAVERISREKLEQTNIMKPGESIPDWLERVAQMKATWSQGRKTSRTAIQWLSKPWDIFKDKEGEKQLQKALLAYLRGRSTDWMLPGEGYDSPNILTPVKHEQLVKKALAEGKPVPEKVLAEYPELREETKPDRNGGIKSEADEAAAAAARFSAENPRAGGSGGVSGAGAAEPRQGAAGEETSVIVPGEDHEISTRYEVRDLSGIQPSHNGITFLENPAYAHHNERDYAKPENQQRVINQASPGKFNPRYLVTDNPDATNGPPIIDQDGHVLGGNSRAMTLQRVYGSNAAAAHDYRALLAKKAAAFGIDPQEFAHLENPVLVRVASVESLAKLPGGSKWAIRKTNVSGTAALSASERATADAGQLSPELKGALASAIEDAGPGATLNDALTGTRGTALANELIAKGFFSEQERPALMDGKTGALTQLAKDRISKALLGGFFRDSDQFQRFPAALKQKLERIAAPLATIANDPAWDLEPAVREAVDLIEYANAHDIQNIDDVTAQSGLFGNNEDQWSDRAITLAKLLREAKPNDVVHAFRRYVTDKEPTMFGEFTPDEAFVDAFEGPGQTVFADLDPDQLPNDHPVAKLAQSGWRSQLVDTIQAKLPARVSPQQALAALKNPQNGVKPDELKWTDMEDWLAKQTGPLTRDQILNHALQNLVVVNEVQANRPGHPSQYAKYLLKGAKKDYHELLFLIPNPPNAKARARTELQEKFDAKYGTEAKYPISTHYARQLGGEPVKYRWSFDGEALGENDPLTPEERAEWKRVNNAWMESWHADDERPTFRSQHWSYNNVLAHVRFDERTDLAGRRILFLEELQSDWHQKGRDQGYRTKGATEEVARLRDEIARIKHSGATEAERAAYFQQGAIVPSYGGFDRVIKYYPGTDDKAWSVTVIEQTGRTGVGGDMPGARPRNHATDPGDALIRNHQMRIYELDKGVPDAPFAKNWHEMVFRRMVRWAAENGFDAVAWTTGKQQAARYDLAKHVAGIKWHPVNDEYLKQRYDRDYATKFPNPEDRKPGYLLTKTLHEAKIGTPDSLAYQRFRGEAIPQGELPDYLGKEAARKLLATEKQYGQHTLEGKSMQVGGHGMSGFYDGILPAYAAKFGKKWGVAPKLTKIASPLKPKLPSVAEQLAATQEARAAGQPLPVPQPKPRRRLDTVHSLDVTFEMQDSVLRGQPLFARELKGEARDPNREYTPSELIQAADWETYPATDRRPVRMRLNWQATHLLQAAFDTRFVGLTADQKTAIAASSILRELAEKLADRGAITTPEAQRLGQLAAALRDLQRASGGKPVYLYREGQPESDRPGAQMQSVWRSAATQREELTHVQQFLYARGNEPGKHLAAQQANVADHPAWPLIRGELEKLGYQQPRWTTEHQILEAAAKGMSGKLLNVPAPTMNAWLESYYRALVKVHGPAAAQEVFRYAQRKFRIKPDQEDDAGNLRSQDQDQPRVHGGSGGSDESSGPVGTRGREEDEPLPDLFGESDDEQNSLFGGNTEDELARASEHDKNTLQGERLTAQFKSPLTRDEQLKKLKRSKENPQTDLFGSNEEPDQTETAPGSNPAPRDPMGQQGSLFERDNNEYLGSGLGAFQPFIDKFLRSDVRPTLKQAAYVLRLAKDDILKQLAPAARGPAAEATALSTRTHAAEMARSTDRARVALSVAARYFDGQPADDNFAFVDRVEKGEDQPTPELQQFADIMRDILDSRRQAIQALGTGKLQNFIENYFPHVWKNPEQAKQAFENWGKRPLEGSKSFLKKRTVATFADGIAMGLEPISDNPVDLVLGKAREMDKYLTAHNILHDLKERGLLRFVDAREGRAPNGWVKVNDPVATVYGPSIQPITEYPNAGLWSGLERVAAALGLKHERGFMPMGEAVGRAYKANGNVKTKHGTAEDVFAHEIGHQIDWLAGSGKKFVLEYPDKQTVERLQRARRTLKDMDGTTLEQRRAAREELKNLEAAIQDRKAFAQELRDLADLRSGPKEYTHKREEKMAQLAEMWVGARPLFERTAPHVFARWKEFLNENPKLHALRDIEGDTEVKPISQPYDVGGLVIKGHWWAPEPAARILHHYLSPGLRDQSALFRAYLGLGNILNQAQLGFSAFHLAFTSVDAATSKLALGFYQTAHGDLLKGLGTAAQTPIAPFAGIVKGDKLMKEWFAPGTQGAEIAQLVEALVKAGGRAQMDGFYQTHVIKNLVKAFRQGNIVGALVRLPGAAAEAAAWPIMQYIVPRQKLAVFADMAAYELGRLGPDATEDEQRQAMAKAWDSVDNRMGQLVYDNLFWHKVTKDLAMASVRSVGWNVGTIREIAGGLNDVKNTLKNGPEFTHRMAYILALPVVAGLLGAMLYYLWHGHAPKKLKDYYFPTDAHGHRWSLPTYVKDVYEYSTDPLRTVKGKVHPLLATILEMLANKDYFDKPIRNPHHSLVKQAEELATFAGKEFMPLAYRTDKHHKQQTSEERTLGSIGIKPAPKSLH